MNCETYTDLLDDYVDGARAADDPGNLRRHAFESHMADCAHCQALVADFTSIRSVAASLEEHVPSPRLWARIAASLEAGQRRAWMPLAAAAALALVVGGGAWLAWKQVSPVRDEATLMPETAVVPVEQHYDEAIAGLQQLADSQDSDLDPATRAVLKQNLAVVDRAINESRAALATDPSSALAQDSLLDALDTKVALLQEGLALAPEELNQ
jgi:hypothetical protein